MISYLFSCDNATCAVPEAYREIFRGSEELLVSTEGWEPGALNLAQGFAMKFRTPLVHGDVTRLLIDLDRDGDDRWSRFSLQLPESTRSKIIDRHERPYRAMLSQRLAEDLRRHDGVLHTMVHTHAMTDGKVLIETSSNSENSNKIAEALCAIIAGYGIEVNFAAGTESGAIAKKLVTEFPVAGHARIRLSASQSFFLEGRPTRWDTVKKILLDSLASAVAKVGIC